MAKLPLLLLTCLAATAVQSFQIATTPRQQHRRGFALRMTSQAPDVDSKASVHKPHSVVIVGGGIGGLSSAFDARHVLHSTDIVTVISDRESFEFTPSNPWVALGKRRPEDIRVSLTKVLPRHKIEFVNQKVAKLNPKVNQLQLADKTFVNYDYLIIATGPKLAFDNIPGAGPDKHSVSICSTKHAVAAYEKFQELVENPGPVVVGAVQESSCFGPAYVSCYWRAMIVREYICVLRTCVRVLYSNVNLLSPLFLPWVQEYAMLLHYELERLGGKELVDKCPITFITPEPYLGHLGLQGAGDSKEVLTELMGQRNIEWIVNCSVGKIRGDAVEVSYLQESADGAMVAKTKTLPSKLTMVIPPFRGLGVWSAVPGLTDKHGLILTDEHQQSTKYPNIFGVGVCVAIPPVEKTLVPTGPPKTGYLIESQGSAAVKNIQAMIEYHSGVAKETTKHATDKDVDLHYKSLMNGLCITDFGDDGAVFITLPQLPPRHTDITIHGKLVTLAKVAFEKYFIHKVKTGDTDPGYEKYMLELVGIKRTLTE